MKIKKTGLKVALCISICIGAVSCAKDDPVIDDPGNNPPDPDAAFFGWTIGAGQLVTADSAVAYVASYVIFAFEPGGSSVELNLSEMTAGNYTISPATGNQLQYNDGTQTDQAYGTLTITASSPDEISGKFEGELQNSTGSAITGTFINIPKR